MSFASVQQDNWDDIHESLCIKIREEYNEHSELLSSDVLQNGEKEFYNRIVNGGNGRSLVTGWGLINE